MSVRNTTRGTVLVERLLNLNAGFRNTLRFINRTGMPRDCGVWISPCQAICTVGVRGPIDIAFLDHGGRIVKVLKRFPPNCLAESASGAVSALELPPDRIEETGTRRGDVLDLDPC
ncbi:MAG: DUF192 domain-containing protein [Candidatus Krumholzibacteriota bacterium]|nr:DUF192 domain-containing protein [Candidatus Krumholzibacteriota bacterium]